MKVALIGVGHWGRNHLKVYSDLKEEGVIDEVVVFDIKKDHAKRIAKSFQIECCNDIHSLLDNKEVTIASIATPSPTHYILTKEFLQAGKDVLVEKPLTLNSNESWKLVKLANQLNRILMVGHLFRFHNAVSELRRIIQRGDLGDIIKISIERKSFGVPRQDMGVLHALGIHDVDISCYLVGEKYPKEIGAYSQSYYRLYPDEIATVFQKFSNGAIAISNESWLNPVDGKIRRLFVLGSRGSAHIDFLVHDTLNLIDSYIEQNDGEDLRVINDGVRIKRLDSSEPLRNEIVHFIDCSLNDKEILVGSEIGARAVEMIEIAFESIKSRKIINVNEYFQHQE